MFSTLDSWDSSVYSSPGSRGYSVIATPRSRTKLFYMSMETRRSCFMKHPVITNLPTLSWYCLLYTVQSCSWRPRSYGCSQTNQSTYIGQFPNNLFSNYTVIHKQLIHCKGSPPILTSHFMQKIRITVFEYCSFHVTWPWKLPCPYPLKRYTNYLRNLSLPLTFTL